MKLILKKIFIAIMVMTMIFSFSTVDVEAVKKKSKTPELEKTSVTLHCGEQHTIKIKNIPKTAKVKYTYTSDNRYVSVSKNGIVKAKNYPGKQSKITVHASIIEKGKKTEKKYTLKLSVKIIKEDSNGDDKTSDKGKNPELNKKTVSLLVGNNYTIKIKNVPKNAELKCTYKTNNSYVSVSKKGIVKAKNYPGKETKITIKATIKEKGKKAKNYTFTQKVKITKKKTYDKRTISLDRNELTIEYGDSYWLDALVDGYYADDEDVKWSSNNPSIASVNKFGEIDGKSEGIAVITAKLSNGETATCKVTVTAAKPSSIKLDGTKSYLVIGESITLVACIFPEYAGGDVQWSVSNSQRVTLKSSGNEATITAKEKGNVTIYASCGNCSTSYNLLIVDKVYGINEIWEVDGQWRFKFTGVRNHWKDCFLTNRTKDAAKVIMVDYSYDYYGSSYTSFVDLSKVGDFYDSCGCLAESFICPENNTVSSRNGWMIKDNTVALKNRGEDVIFIASVYNMETKTNETAIFDLSKKATVDLDSSDMMLYINETGKFKAKTYTDDLVLWQSENENVAKVDYQSGVITPVGAGQTRIIAIMDGSQAFGTVTVDPRRSIELEKTNIELFMNETGKFIATTDLTDPIIWSSDDTSVVTVNQSTGEITPVGPGIAAISAKQSGRIAIGTVRVNPLKITPVSSMGSNLTQIKIRIENTSDKSVYGFNNYGVGITNGTKKEGLMYINGDMLYSDSVIPPGESVTYTFKMPLRKYTKSEVPFTFTSNTTYLFTFYYNGKVCCESNFGGELTSGFTE